MQKASVSIIAALGTNRAIGKNNTLLWHISDDLKRFKTLTLGNPIVMGRKTFESIGKPLPGRTSIVITRNPSWTHEGVLVAHSVEEAIKKVGELEPKEIFIIGGAEIYTKALPYTDRLYLTHIEDIKEGDAFFPPYELLFTKKTFQEKRIDEKSGLRYTWVNLEKENL